MQFFTLDDSGNLVEVEADIGVTAEEWYWAHQPIRFEADGNDLSLDEVLEALEVGG